MKNTYIYLLMAFAAFAAFLSFQGTYALFQDTVSVSNTFTAAAVFPSLTPSATIIPTPTDSIEPTSPASPTPTTILPTPTGTVEAGDVVINEINWAGANADSDDEWLELKNMTHTEIDISGWKVINLSSGTNGPITIPNEKKISPQGFFLISRKNELNSRISIDPNYVVSISLNNASELLTLQTPTGTTIDVAGKNLGTWYAGSNGNPKKSTERNLIPGDGTISTNWHTATSSANMDVGSAELGTPRAENGI